MVKPSKQAVSSDRSVLWGCIVSDRIGLSPEQYGDGECNSEIDEQMVGDCG